MQTAELRRRFAARRCEIVVEPSLAHPGIQALVQRFGQYIDDPPAGPLLVVTLHRWTGWAASP